MKRVLFILLLTSVGFGFYLFKGNPMNVSPTIPLQVQEPLSRIVSGINYAKTTDREQELDLYIPAVRNFTTVVFVHGGSWSNGSKEMYIEVGKYLQANGLGCAVINYRLSPRVTFPTHAHDTAAAIAWVKQNIANYGGDSKIFIYGHSAGAHLSALICCDPRYLEAVGMAPREISGALIVSGIYLINYNVNFYGAGKVFRGCNRADCSPINHIPPNGHIPFFILYADRDIPTFERQSKNFHNTLLKKGNKSQLNVFSGQSHSSILDQLCIRGNAFEKDVLKFLGSY